MYSKKMYSKTSKLQARFRGQKALVVEVLGGCSNPMTVDALIPLVDKGGRYLALLNNWARENGGVKGSILFHLRALKRLGMVTENGWGATSRGQIVTWGNGSAIRIPNAILEQAKMREGDEVDISVENGRIALEPVKPKVTLETLVAGITPENRHGELDWGPPVGREIW
jgi:antitoxin MazE